MARKITKGLLKRPFKNLKMTTLRDISSQGKDKIIVSGVRRELRLRTLKTKKSKRRLI